MKIKELYKLLEKEIKDGNGDKEIVFEWQMIDLEHEIQELLTPVDISIYYIDNIWILELTRQYLLYMEKNEIKSIK